MRSGSPFHYTDFIWADHQTLDNDASTVIILGVYGTDLPLYHTRLIYLETGQSTIIRILRAQTDDPSSSYLSRIPIDRTYALLLSFLVHLGPTPLSALWVCPDLSSSIWIRTTVARTICITISQTCSSFHHFSVNSPLESIVVVIRGAHGGFRVCSIVANVSP